jgi:hypothetical protein
MAATQHDHQQREPADQQGEQWHGAHSDEREPREPRRTPGGVQRTVEPADGGDPRP